MAHTILHIPRSNINGVSSPYGRLPFLDFLVNAESLIYLEDNVHIWFQEPQTKLWLFDTLVAPSLFYSVNDYLHDKEKSICTP